MRKAQKEVDAPVKASVGMFPDEGGLTIAAYRGEDLGSAIRTARETIRDKSFAPWLDDEGRESFLANVEQAFAVGENYEETFTSGDYDCGEEGCCGHDEDEGVEFEGPLFEDDTDGVYEVLGNILELIEEGSADTNKRFDGVDRQRNKLGEEVFREMRQSENRAYAKAHTDALAMVTPVREAVVRHEKYVYEKTRTDWKGLLKRGAGFTFAVFLASVVIELILLGTVTSLTAIEGLL